MPVRVLILEDNPDDAELVEREVRKTVPDAEVRRTADQQTFERAIAAEPPDLILCDHNLGQFTGAAALRLAKARHPDVPFILITGSLDEETAVHYMKEGAADYILKTSLVRLGPAMNAALAEAAQGRALARQQQVLQHVLDTDPNMIFVKDWEGRYVLANRAVAEIYGTTVETLAGRTDADFSPNPAEVARFVHNDRDVMASGQRKLILEEPVTSPTTGHTRWFQTVKVPLRLPGEDQTFVLGVATDITERKQGEAERAFLALVIEQTDESVLITDVEGRITYVNPAFERTSGYTRAEVLGENPRLFKSGLHDAEFYRRLWQTLAAGDSWHGRLVNRRKDGTLYHQKTIISPVRAEAGHIVSYVGVGRDVTREVELEEQLRQVQKLEAIGQLTGGIAHDFNNILGVILGGLHLVREGLARADAGVSPDLDEIERAVNRGAAMVRQLLGFSRRSTLTLAPTDLARVVRDHASMLQRLLPERIELQVSADGPVGTVMADGPSIDQILLNLGNNARDAMPENGVLRLHVDEQELDETYREAHPWVHPGRYVCLTVSDTGHGMDAEIRRRVFEPFFTTKAPGQGTGLGLAMVYGLVKQHDGFIHVYTEPGRGTAFRLYFPIVADRVPETATPSRPVEVRGGRETILLVEDEDALRRMARRALEGAGYRVIEAADGEAALEAYRSHRDEVALVISDLVMPKLGGLELYRRLRSEGAGVPVLLVSGYSEDTARSPEGLAALPPLLQKPWTIGTLLARVREMLDQ